MKLKIAAAVAVLILAVAGFFVFTQKPAAPDVTFSTLQGQSFRTADLRGKVVLVNFWATTCTSCIKEMPALKATQERFEARGYRTVAVAMDYDPPAQVAAFVERSALPFTFVLDRDGILQMRKVVRDVAVAHHVKDYAIRVLEATHPDRPSAPEKVKRFVRFGASPRGAQAMLLAAKIRALMDGRFAAAIDDVRWAATPALRHRVILNFEGEAEGVRGDDVLAEILATVKETGA